MKIAYQQLSTHLKNNLLPIYLIAGNEAFLMREAKDAIRLKAKSKGFVELERFEVGKDFDWNQLIESANSLSLFSNQRFMEIKLTAKPSAAASKLFTDFITQINTDITVLIITEKLDSATQKSSWVEAINKRGVIVTIWPLDKSQFKQFVEQRLHQNNLKCDQQSIQFLISHTEGNLLALTQEIDKLKLIFKDEPISFDDLVKTISDNSRYDVFNFIDIILSSNPAQIIKALKRLHTEPTEPSLLLWAITKEIRLLIHIVSDLKNNVAWENITRKHQVWDRKQPLIKNILKVHSATTLHKLLLLAGKIDEMIKGLRSGNVWEELELLALGLGAPREIALLIYPSQA